MKLNGRQFRALGAVMLLAALAGCSAVKKEEGAITTAEAKRLREEAERARRSGNVSGAAERNAQAAEIYARIGELLMMPEGLQHADTMFDKALEADAGNAKANFYKAWTGPMMQAKGFVARFEPLAVRERDQRAVRRLRSEIAKLRMPEVESFANELPQSERAFREYYDIQRFAREKLLPAFVKAQEHLAKVDVTKPLKLNFTPERARLDATRDRVYYSSSYSSCTQTSQGEWSCQNDYWNYEYVEKKQRNEHFIDQYDLKLLKNAYAAMTDSIRLGTAYGAKGVESAIRRLKAIDDIRRQSGREGATHADTVGVLREFPQLFTLERDQQLGELRDSTTAAIRRQLEFAELREQLCDNPTRTEETSVVRPICLEAEVVDQLQLGLDLLSGPKDVLLGQNRSGSDVKIVMDLSTVLRNPIKDLKAQLPRSFDAEGNPVNYPDGTMGGLFPNGDFV
ncbi:MAG TPA: hypothetical protein VM598_06575, partial [Bdellovibrionota bacterium]|nr:hypothetical protein [Bdellovibrionota bacterium]